MIKDRASIHDRPRDVEGRADIGHWEGDLVDYDAKRNGFKQTGFACLFQAL
jgi:IS30 family transposase